MFMKAILETLISKRMTEFGMFKFLKLFGVLQKNQRNN
jgi:hypothetical protein